MADFGVSFMPSAQPNGERPPVEPMQQAIKILSLRLPKIQGGAYAPLPLMQAPGSGGSPFARSGIGMTQGAMLPPMAGGPDPFGSVSGAQSPGFGGMSPDVLAAVMRILARARPSGGQMPLPRIEPRKDERHPTPIGSEQVPVPSDAMNVDLRNGPGDGPSSMHLQDTPRRPSGFLDGPRIQNF